MKIFVVPIESYDDRYTEQWNRWFPSHLTHLGVDFRVIVGDEAAVSPPDPGQVLDQVGTNLFKAQQLTQIIRLIAQGDVVDDDVFLFHTLWFPGLEALSYIRNAGGPRFKITGFLHAGAYDPWDFRHLMGMDPWAAGIEEGWLNLVDRVFIATDFHKRMVLGSRKVDPHKIVVTGLPFDSAEIRQGRAHIRKEALIAFPHRPAREKQPQTVDLIRRLLPGVPVVETRKQTASKRDYLDLLARCTWCVSNSLQETWGYSMLEAVALGCMPVVPDRLCYPEMYPPEFCFSSLDEMITLLAAAPPDADAIAEGFRPLIAWADSALDRVIRMAMDW